MTIPHFDVDVLIVGSGFGGSLTALLCRQIGLRPLVVDAGTHPRFAIGESSTPLANLVLDALAQRYDLPWLRPLANYAAWKRTHPELGVGLKRGFSYFHHQCGKAFRASPQRNSELLVAASHGLEDADTHWLRADFDNFLVQQLARYDIPCCLRTRLGPLSATTSGWRVSGHQIIDGATDEHAAASPRLFESQSWTATARFVVDASGSGGYLAKVLAIGDATAALHTRSRAIFAHFEGVRRWEGLYCAAGGSSAEHPFPADDAALHHVFPGGWMWVLRFDHGVTSAGFCLDTDAAPSTPPNAEWQSLLDRLPSVAEQFAGAKIVSPGASLRAIDRLQHRVACAAGPNWALLPSAAGFIDPLHSTGIAHTLIGIERLITALERHWNRPGLSDALAEYDRLWQQEVSFIDQIVAGCYRSFEDFPRMIAMSLFYFATAIWSEVRRRNGNEGPTAFLCADDPTLQSAVACCRQIVSDPTSRTSDVVAEVLRTIEPINLAGLGDPSRQNLYPYVE